MKTGTRPKFNTLKQQREAAELELIIEEFGRAMRNAYRPYMAKRPSCQHDDGPRFTLGMEMAWNRYIAFCMDHNEQA